MSRDTRNAFGRSFIVALMFAAGFVACDESAVAPTEPVVIAIEPDSMDVAVDSDAALSAVVRDAANNEVAGITLEWSSSDSTVATVTPTAAGAVVNALSEGRAEIRATAGELEATAVVRVVADLGGAASIVVVGDPTIVHTGSPGVGQSAHYIVRALDADGQVIGEPTTGITWSATGALLDERNLPRGTLLRAWDRGPGSARIRASWNGLSDDLAIQVLAAAPAGEVTVMLTTTWLMQGETTEAWVWAIDAEGNEVPDSLVTLTAEDPALLSFQWTGGAWRATGLAEGFTHVRASYGDLVSGSAPVRVIYAPLELNVVGPDTVLTGGTVRYSYGYRYGGGWFDDGDVVWSVTDPSVARIIGTSSDNGKTGLVVEFVTPGTAEITMTATGPDGTFSATRPLTVLDGAGTTRIIYQNDRSSDNAGLFLWLVPELGLTRELGRFYSGDGARLMPSARANGAYAYVVTSTPFSADLMSIRVVDAMGVGHYIDFAPRDNEPALHPEEDLLAFTVNRGGYVTSLPTSIAIAPFSGGTMDSLALGTSPTWSPDGDTIAYARGGAIYKISRHGGSEIFVADVGGAADLDWSPDGTRLIFGSGGGVYVMDADGSNLVRVADGAQPDWAPDGERYVFNQGGMLAIGRLGSATVTYLPSAEGDRLSYPVWYSVD